MRVGGVMKAGAFVNFDPIDAVPLPSRRSEEEAAGATDAIEDGRQ